MGTPSVDEMRRSICLFLTRSSNAENLGDIRNAEDLLWEALGVPRKDVDRAYFNDDDPRSIVRVLGKAYGLPFEDWVLMAPDDEDGE